MFNRVRNQTLLFRQIIFGKTFCAFLLLLFYISFSETFSQYYIDQSKIDELETRKVKNYIIPQS